MTVLKHLLFTLLVLSFSPPAFGAGEGAPGRNDSTSDVARQRFAEHARNRFKQLAQEIPITKPYVPLQPPAVPLAELLPAPKPVVAPYIAKLPPAVALPSQIEKPIVAQIASPKREMTRAPQNQEDEQFNKGDDETALLDDDEPLIFQQLASRQDETPKVVVIEEVEAATTLFSKTGAEASHSEVGVAQKPKPVAATQSENDTQLAAPPEILTGTLSTISKQAVMWLFVLFVVLPIALKYNPVFFYRLFTANRGNQDEDQIDLDAQEAVTDSAKAEATEDLSVLDDPDEEQAKPSRPFASVDNIEDIHAELSSTLHDVDQYLSGVDTATGIALATKAKTAEKTDQQTVAERLMDSQQLQMQTTEFRLIANSAAHKAIQRYSNKQRTTFRLLRGVAASMAATGLAGYAWSVPGVYGLTLGASCIAVGVIAAREFRAWQELREQE